MTIKNYNQLKQKLTELNQKYIQENQEKIQQSKFAGISSGSVCGLGTSLNIVIAVLVAAGIIATGTAAPVIVAAGATITGFATIWFSTYSHYEVKSLVAENNNLEAEINFMNNDNANELLQEETGKMVLMKKDFANFKEWVSSFFSRREILSGDASHPVVGRVVGRRIETQGFLAV